MELMAKSYIAFFDLDRTTLSINSGSVLVREAYKRRLMGPADLLNAIYLSWLYKFRLRDTTLIISGMGKWLKGLTVDEVNSLAEHVVNKHLVNAIRPEIYSEIKSHKKQSAEIVILSSVIIEICRHIGSHLEVDNFICTTMEISDGVYTGLPEKSFCFDDEKRMRLKEYCEFRNYNLSESYYYGDSIYDLPALEIVGHPVCVKPDRKLARIARKRGWRVL
jgi:putative phosphoserine phosphatase/1-acylglycerol-3-phosphate O-acyltransferase